MQRPHPGNECAPPRECRLRPPPPPPPGTCTETRREDNTADIFSLDLLSAPKPKLFVKKEICDFCCAEKSDKILKATAFFFFLSRKIFSFAFFQSEEKSSQLISLFCFFSSTSDLYSHTLCSIPAKHYCKSFLRAREREIQREMSRML